MKLFETLREDYIYHLTVDKVVKYGETHYATCTENPKKHEGCEYVLLVLRPDSYVPIPAVGDEISVYGKGKCKTDFEECIGRTGKKFTRMHDYIKIDSPETLSSAIAYDKKVMEGLENVLDGEVNNVKFKVSEIKENKNGKMFAWLLDEYNIRYYKPYKNWDFMNNIEEGKEVYLLNGKIISDTGGKGNINRTFHKIVDGILSRTPNNDPVIENRKNIGTK